MQKYIKYISLILSVGLFVKVYSMEIAHNNISDEESSSNFIVENYSYIYLMQLEIADIISKNSIFDPLNDVKKVIKAKILKNFDFGNCKNIVKNYLMKFACAYIKQHFAKDKLNCSVEEREDQLKKLLCGRDYKNAEVEAAKLIIAGINVNLHIKHTLSNTVMNLLTFIIESNKFKNLIKLLIMSGIELNDKDNVGSNALMWAFAKGETEIVKLLLLSKRLDINFQNNNGFTILMKAVNANRLDVVNLLLQCRPDIDINVKDKAGGSALTRSYYMGNKDIFMKLLEYGKLTIDVQQNGDWTNIMYLNPETRKNVNVVRFN